MTAGDVYLAALPVEFNFTWGCPGVIGTLHKGGTVVLADDPGADDCFSLITREKVTVTSVVPTVAHLWLEAREYLDDDLSTLRLMQIGGARLQPELAARIEPELGCRLQQVFGMAEGLLSMSRLDDPVERVIATQGRPVSPYDEIQIVDGELLARGPYTLRGYYNAPDHNADGVHLRRVLQDRRPGLRHARRRPGHRGPDQGRRHPGRRQDRRR